MRRRVCITLGLMVALLVPGPALAQEREAEAEMAPTQESVYFADDESWKDRRFHVGAFGGQMLGGTALGLTENLFFRTTFNTDKGTLWGARFGWVFASRFELEAEYGTAQPDLLATLTDLSGRDKTEVYFADLKMSYLMAVVNYSMIERTRRLVPYLSLGLGTVRVDSDDESLVGAREVGIIFGAGLRFRIVDALLLRADARGLRSGFGTNQTEGDLPRVFVGDYNASNFLWSFGLDFRF